MRLVTPEQWYRVWWLLYGAAAIVAMRLWLVNPIRAELRAVKVSVERQTALMTGARAAE